MASKRQIFITVQDLQRLQDHLDNMPPGDRKQFQPLELELGRAKVVDAKKIPANVVTMNSRLRYRDAEDGGESEITLVFPDGADIETGKMSILSPIGTALLGYAVGDTIEWAVPAGSRQIEILELLYQPEAAGDYHV